MTLGEWRQILSAAGIPRPPLHNMPVPTRPTGHGLVWLRKRATHMPRPHRCLFDTQFGCNVAGADRLVRLTQLRGHTPSYTRNAALTSLQRCRYSVNVSESESLGPWKARPTLYKGIRMRSRLEARYAQHLDRNGFRWEYEPDCYGDETGDYLPDFLIVGNASGASRHPTRLYIEIKPFLTVATVIDAAPRMERIFATHPTADLVIYAPNKDRGFDNPDAAQFYKGDWWLCRAEDSSRGTLVWSSGRA